MFEHLKNHQHGEIWRRLVQLQPTTSLEPFLELGPVESLLESGRGVIYHYTTVIGLQGILETNRLWASAAYYLNDSSEVEYGSRLLHQELSTWLTANQSNPCFAVDVLQGLDAIFSSPLSRISRTSTIYVTCFCENGNLLSQWRAYGQAGGYSLGFSVVDGNIALKTPGGFWDLRLARVIYLTHLQRDRVNSLLKEALVVLSDPSLESVSAPERLNLIRDAIVYMQESLLDEIVAFKNPAFAEEREWRLIVRPNLLRAPEMRVQEQQDAGFKFRGLRGSLVPYLELQPVEQRLPLRSIRFGPSLEASRTENSVRMLLASCGFKNVGVTGSEIPVIL